MANLVISGDTSGSVTLAAPAVSGTTVLTLPTTSGTIVTTAGATSLTTSGNLTFTGTGNRITGDMSNATLANRVYFQTSTTNSNTTVPALPNGTGNQSQFLAYNGTDPANSGLAQLLCNTAEVSLRMGIAGTGTYLPLTMYTGGAERLRIDTSGNVGIGIAPAAWSGFKALQINSLTNFWNNGAAGGASYYSNNLYYNGSNRIYQTTGFASEYTMGSGIHTWSTASSGTAGNTVTLNEYMRIDSSGNVGIGTNSPAKKLDVAGDITFGSANKFTSSANVLDGVAGQNGARIRSAVSSAENPTFSNIDDTNTGMFFPAADTIAFTEGGAESMRIDSNGRLNINCTTNPLPANGAGRINMIVPSGDDGINIRHNHTGNCLNIWRTAGDGFAITFYQSTAPSQVLVGGISTSSSATTYATSSDYRLKENVTPMTGALNTVAQLKPVTYTWKADGSDGQGFIAHELQAVVPDCVTGEKDAVDEEGNIKPQGIDTSFLVATLTAAIQELNAKVTALEKQLGAK
jgi:hypothetical protein